MPSALDEETAKRWQRSAQRIKKNAGPATATQLLAARHPADAEQSVSNVLLSLGSKVEEIEEAGANAGRGSAVEDVHGGAVRNPGSARARQASILLFHFHCVAIRRIGWHSSLEKKNHRHFLVHFLALFTD
jgi:hypothetical protein